MDLTFVSRPEISPAEWDEVVLHSPDGWAYSRFDWQEIILSVALWELEDFSFGIIFNSALVAVMPLQLSRASLQMASSGWGGSGLVIHEKLEASDRLAITKAGLLHANQQAEKNAARELTISLSPVTRTSIETAWGVNPLAFHGFEDVSQISQVVDLSKPEEELRASLSKFAKRQINKATKLGIHSRLVEWQEHLDSYYDLHCATYDRTGVKPHPKRYFEGIASKMSKLKHAFLLAAFDSDQVPVAYHNTCRFKQGATYHTGCSTEPALDSGANYQLFWQAMLEAKNAGLQWYECGPIFPGTGIKKLQGLTEFKTKFGGEPHRLFAGKRVLESEPSSTPTPPQGIKATGRQLCSLILKRFSGSR